MTMTDLEKFIELYKSVGIEPHIQESEGGGKELHIYASDDPQKTGGFMGFFTSIDFDPEGNFIMQGFYEY